jgi:hypothetical protein
MLYRIIIFIFLSLSLIACKQNDVSSYAYNVTHPEAALATYKACEAHEQGDDLRCKNAAQAVHDLADLQKELVQDPQAFGQKVLAAQEKLVALKTSQGEQAKALYAAQLLTVNTYLAVCKISGE